MRLLRVNAEGVHDAPDTAYLQLTFREACRVSARCILALQNTCSVYLIKDEGLSFLFFDMTAFARTAPPMGYALDVSRSSGSSASHQSWR